MTYVINLEGQEEPFSYKKVYQSARRVGASDKLAKEIAAEIEKEVYPGMSTAEIFKKVKHLLKKEKPKAALKFNLKEAMKKLGPTGFPFEKYVGAIFSELGYEVQLNRNLKGFCCTYETDFIAKKGNLVYIGECKYRNSPGDKIHTDTALATHAGFLDIQKGDLFKGKDLRSLLVTNTKFTRRAAKYSKCVGDEILGWRYPKGKGLEKIIEENKLYPITILPSLNKHLAEIFVSQKIMLARDLFRKDVDVKKGVFEKLKKEAEILIKDVN